MDSLFTPVRALNSSTLDMPTFDIVSEVNPMELDNALNQARKELATRFDFKDSPAEIILEKSEIQLKAQDAHKMRTLVEIILGRLAKRGVSLKNIEKGEPDLSPLGHARQTIKIKQGIEAAVAKEISAFVRQLGLKVTAQIQGDLVRVSGKNKDDLQSVIAALRSKDFPLALNFRNFRD